MAALCCGGYGDGPSLPLAVPGPGWYALAEPVGLRSGWISWELGAVERLDVNTLATGFD